MNYAETMFPLPNGWECSDSGDLFCEIFPTAKDIPAHGWKLRINVPCLESFPDVLRAISSICFSEKIPTPMKFASSATSVKRLTAKNIGIDIAGKLITLYPGPDASVLIDLVKKLTQPLSALSLPPSAVPWSDKPIGAHLSYRYGSYQPQSTIRIAGVDFKDRRDIFQLPPGILDPFDNSNSTPPSGPEPEEVPEAVRLHDDYEIESVLTRNWGGSVYAGRSLCTNEKLIFKEARPDAIIACSEVLSTDLLTHEHSVLKAIENFQIAPVPVDFFEIDRHLFLVLPKLGVNLLKWRLYHGSNPDRCKAVARAIASQLSFLHNKTATSHGDISSANTIISDDGSVRLIDFEMARQNATKEDLAEDTKQFVTVLRTLLLLNKYNSDTIRLAEQGAPIQHILERLNP